MSSKSVLWIAALLASACTKTELDASESPRSDRSISAVEPARWVDLEIGGAEHGAFGCAVERNGALWCWGRDRDRAYPSRVENISDAIAVAISLDDLCVIRRDGHVACLGHDSWWTVEGIEDAVEIIVTHAGGCAIEHDAELRCWIDHHAPQLVREHVVTAKVPATIEPERIDPDHPLQPPGWTLERDGTLSQWNQDHFARTSGAEPPTANVWDRVPGAIDIAYDEVTSTLWLLDGDGHIRRSSTESKQPRWEQAGRVEGAVQIELSHAQVCVRTDDGHASCRGYNSYGQLGDGSSTSRDHFAAMPVDGVVALAVGDTQTCAATMQDITCAGFDVESRGVDRTLVQHTLPGLVATSLAAHELTTCAINDAGKLLCWGSALLDYPSAMPELGVQLAATPTLVGDAVADLRGMWVTDRVIEWVDDAGALRSAKWIATPTPHLEALDPPGDHGKIEQLDADRFSCTIEAEPNANLLACGAYPSREPLHEVDGPTFVAVDGKMICAIDRHRRVGCARVGDHHDVNLRFPRIPKVKRAVEVAMAVAYDSYCARIDDGHVTCWKYGRSGSDVGLTDVTALVATSAHFCSLDSAGALRCWEPMSSWVRKVASPEFTTELVEIVAGSHHVCARDRAGQVTCWGDEHHGQLGRVPAYFHLSPTPLRFAEDPT
jgi:hypothetical protein